jgi:thiamine monophosphate synthase
MATAARVLGAVTVHVGAMLAVMTLVALLVYDRLGVGVLRRARINTEQAWAATFVVAGAVTRFS